MKKANSGGIILRLVIVLFLLGLIVSGWLLYSHQGARNELVTDSALSGNELLILPKAIDASSSTGFENSQNADKSEAGTTGNSENIGAATGSVVKSPGNDGRTTQTTPGTKTVPQIQQNMDSVAYPTKNESDTAERIPDYEEPEPEPEPENQEEEAPPLWIAGMVMDDKGNIVPGIEVTAHLLRSFGSNQSQEDLTNHSDASGLYLFDDVIDGEYNISTRATDSYPASRIATRAGVDTADIILSTETDLTIYGTVTATQGHAIDRAHVFDVRKPVQTILTDEEGNYTLDVRIKGNEQRVTLAFRHDEYTKQLQHISAAEMGGDDRYRLDVVMDLLNPLVQVTGDVSTTEGEPVIDESVILYSLPLNRYYRKKIDSQGRFTIPSVETGDEYQLEIRPKGLYKDYIKSGLSVNDQNTHFPIVLESTNSSSLSGQMKDTMGNLIPHFSLLLRSKDSIQKAWQITGNGEGRYSIDGLTDGELMFETHSAPHFTISGIHMLPGEHKELDLVIDWGNAEVQGVILNDQGVGVVSAAITLTWSSTANGVNSHSMRKAISDREGYFLFSQLGQGMHRLHASMQGFRDVWIELNVLDQNDLVEIDFEVE